MALSLWALASQGFFSLLCCCFVVSVPYSVCSVSTCYHHDQKMKKDSAEILEKPVRLKGAATGSGLGVPRPRRRVGEVGGGPRCSPRCASLSRSCSPGPRVILRKARLKVLVFLCHLCARLCMGGARARGVPRACAAVSHMACLLPGRIIPAGPCSPASSRRSS